MTSELGGASPAEPGDGGGVGRPAQQVGAHARSHPGLVVMRHELQRQRPPAGLDELVSGQEQRRRGDRRADETDRLLQPVRVPKLVERIRSREKIAAQTEAVGTEAASRIMAGTARQMGIEITD